MICDLGLRIGVVRYEALEVADRYSRMTHPEMDTLALALFLLRAYTSANSRQRRTLLDDGSCTEDISFLEFLDEARNMYIHRTALYACRVLAVEAPVALCDRLLKGQTLVHLLAQTLHTHLRTQLRHLYARNSHAVLRRAGEGRNGNPSRPPLKGGVLFVGCCTLVPLGFPSVYSLSDSLSLVSRQSDLVLLQRLRLLGFVGLHAAEHLRPVHLMGVKFRSVHADELGLSSNRHAARAAHARSVDHDGVERCLGRDIIFGGSEGNELHHDSRTDRDTFIHGLAVDDFFHSYGNDTLFAHRAVIGHDNHFIGPFRQFVPKDEQVFVPRSENRDDPVSGFLERLGDRQHRSGSHASAGAYDRTVFLYTRSASERSYYVMQTFSRLHRQ